LRYTSITQSRINLLFESQIENRTVIFNSSNIQNSALLRKTEKRTLHESNNTESLIIKLMIRNIWALLVSFSQT